jgi:hypothetical protein
VGGCKTSHIHFWCLHGHSYRVTTVSVMMRQMIRRRICLKPTLGPFDSYHYRFAKNQEAALHVRENVCNGPLFHFRMISICYLSRPVDCLCLLTLHAAGLHVCHWKISRPLPGGKAGEEGWKFFTYAL